jgi:hypothetical protein
VVFLTNHITATIEEACKKGLRYTYVEDASWEALRRVKDVLVEKGYSVGLPVNAGGYSKAYRLSINW